MNLLQIHRFGRSFALFSVLFISASASANEDAWSRKLSQNFRDLSCLTAMNGVIQKLTADFSDAKLRWRGPLNHPTNQILTPLIQTSDLWPSSGISAGLLPAESFAKGMGPTDLKWAQKLHQPVPGGRAAQEEAAEETFEQIHLSPNREFAVTYSNYGHVRIYDAAQDRLLKTVPFVEGYLYDHFGILAVTNQYFVLGENFARTDGSDRNPRIALRSLGKGSAAGDEIGRVVYSTFNETPIAGVHFTRDESKMIVTSISQVSVVDLRTLRVKSYRDERTGFSSPRRWTDKKFPQGWLTTSRLLDDGHTLLVGYRNLSQDFQTAEIAWRTIDLESNSYSPPISFGPFAPLRSGKLVIVAFTHVSNGEVDVLLREGDELKTLRMPIPKAAWSAEYTEN